MKAPAYIIQLRKLLKENGIRLPPSVHHYDVFKWKLEEVLVEWFLQTGSECNWVEMETNVVIHEAYIRYNEEVMTDEYLVTLHDQEHH